MSSKQRDRGRILTPDGLSRLQQAIRAWELEHELRCTQERIKELTSAVKEGGLDPGTIRKILKAKEGVDPESIRCLFTTFGLQLNETDLVSSSRLQVQADPNFVGREGAIADLNALVNRGAKVIVIQARGGVGKTTLARKYLQQEFGSFLEFPIAKETKDIASIGSLIEEKLRQLGEEPGREFFVSLDRLKRKLQDERIGILIDNLEPALDSAGKFIEPHRRYVELLRVLTDPVVQSVTFITSRERLRESSITVDHYMLNSLNIVAWEQFFHGRNLVTDTPAFAALHNAYGGNAKAMDIIRSAILEDYSGDVTAYWQANQHDLFIERDLEDLVTQQFNRLQQIDSDAYNLLCRMGCYRYQDVPTVSIEGLVCLLWDVPENRQRRVVKALQDRSLVEVENGSYWLHPVIRSEALERLRNIDDWKIANRSAAIFWTDSITAIETVEDALWAFEAYYHYMEINDLDSAACTILKRRLNKWQTFAQGESLGGSFNRLNLFQQINEAVVNTVRYIKSERIQIDIYPILGDLFLSKGEIRKSIEYHLRANQLAVKNGHLWRQSASLVSMGVCEIYLLEIKSAGNHFEEAIKVANGSDFYRHIAGTCNFYLAFINSLIGEYDQAFYFAHKSYTEIKEVKLNTRQRGDRLLFLGSAYKNLKNPVRCLELYNEAVKYAQESHYIQLEAQALYHVAEFQRETKDFNNALSNSAKALDILLINGIKPALAEAHYQLALTYQAMNMSEQSHEHFREAIRLFAEVEAPKQVERVKQSAITEASD